MTDPIADMLTRIRNALAVKKTEVILPYSRLKQNLASVLLKHGWLSGVEAADKFLKLTLKYDEAGLAAISGLSRVSRPGQRIYAKAAEIGKLRSGIGAMVISTSKGLMTDTEARQQKVGGEVVCKVW